MRRGPAALAFLSALAWMAEAQPVLAQRPSAERPTYEVGKFGTLYNAVLHSREYPSGLPVQLTWTVKAYESVQVPAGAYQAFRILYLAEYIGDPLRRAGAIAGRQSWSVEMWYAPEAKQ